MVGGFDLIRSVDINSRAPLDGCNARACPSGSSLVEQNYRGEFGPENKERLWLLLCDVRSG